MNFHSRSVVPEIKFHSHTQDVSRNKNIHKAAPGLRKSNVHLFAPGIKQENELPTTTAKDDKTEQVNIQSRPVGIEEKDED